MDEFKRARGGIESHYADMFRAFGTIKLPYTHDFSSEYKGSSTYQLKPDRGGWWKILSA